MPDAKMPEQPQKIGSGLQCDVYDLGNGRVLKKLRSLEERIATCQDWGTRHKQYAGDKAIKYAKLAEHALFYSIRQLKRRKDQIDQAFLGHPVFFEDGSYEQDKVTILGDHLETHTFEENKRAIDSFIDAVLLQWSYHFCDWTFKSANFGITEAGRVILVDLGEIHCARSKVADMARRKLWLWTYTSKKFKDGPLAEYYKQATDERLTEEAFNKIWPKKTNV